MTSQELKDYLAKLGSYGHLGGKKAARNMTPEQRRERALKAVRAREEKRKKKKAHP